MVGGTVIETVVLDDVVWINAVGTGCEEGETCAINVERSLAARCVSEGDTIWWQSGACYWTPLGKPFKDYRLRKVGFSGVPHPLVERALEKLGIRPASA